MSIYVNVTLLDEVRRNMLDTVAVARSESSAISPGWLSTTEQWAELIGKALDGSAVHPDGLPMDSMQRPENRR